MIELSDRLQIIANHIENHESICDIGTDHGYLGIYLNQLNPNRKIILSDVSSNSLNKGIKNADKYDISNIDFRLGSGLEVLDNHEVNTVVIAGMGGLLISSILSEDFDKVHSFDKLILQPRNHIEELRHFLLTNGFKILKNILVRENKFICEILVVEKSNMNSIGKEFTNSILLEIPYDSNYEDIPLLLDFLNRKLLRKNKILNNIKKSNLDYSIEINNLQKEIDYIEVLISEIKRDN